MSTTKEIIFKISLVSLFQGRRAAVLFIDYIHFEADRKQNRCRKDYCNEEKMGTNEMTIKRDR